MSVSRINIGLGAGAKKQNSETLELSRMASGFWRQKHWDKSDLQLRGFVEQLIELGVTTMDHAYVYRSEPQFGRVLQNAPQLREKMEIVSKWGIRPQGFGPLGARATNHYDSSPEHLIESVDQTLSDLNTDYLDLLLIHRPDYLMDNDELAVAFEKMKALGKVRFFGVSNFTCSQFEALQSACSVHLVTNQVEFSPLHLNPLDDGIFDQCQRYGVSPMLWSCLGGGALFSGSDDRSQRVRNVLIELAEELEVDTMDSIIYAWTMQLPCKPLPIIGSGNIERVKTAIAAEGISLTREQWYRVWEASSGYPVP